MGAITSVIAGIGSLIAGISGAFSSPSGLKPNPVMERLEEEAKRQKEEAERREEEARRREEEARRREEEARRREEEARERAEEAKKRAEEAKAREEEAKKLEEEARKQKEEARKRDEEARYREEEARKRDEETKRREEEAKQREEEVKQRQEEARKREEEAKQREEESKKREEESKKREEEARKREEEIKQRQEEARKREEEAKKREEEAKQREEEAKKLKEEVEKLREEIKNSKKPPMGPDNMPTEEDITRAKEKHNYNNKCVNIAVCGRTRTGKSSLINAFRGYFDNDDAPLVARVGITETTENATSYADPDPTKPFIWYDFPGAGTLDIPEWNYFNEQGLFIFDFVIVLFKDTLAETDIAILRECNRFGIPSYLVRSHADDDIEKVLKHLPGYDRRRPSNNVSLRKKALGIYREDTRKNVVKILEKAGIARRKFYRISRDNITAIIQNEEPYSDIVDEDLLLKDILKEIVSRRVWISDEMKTL